MIYGYARVSTDGQSVEAQVDELTAAGCGKVFRETVSGARADRTQLKRAIAALEADDVLVVTRLDRLARSTRDLLNILAVVSDKGARFRSIRDAWADTWLCCKDWRQSEVGCRSAPIRRLLRNGG